MKRFPRAASMVETDRVRGPATGKHQEASRGGGLWRWLVLRRKFVQEMLICAGVIAIALCLGLYRIGVPGLWFDEILSVERASQPLDLLWQIVKASQPNMALYYFLLQRWHSETVKR